MNRLEEKFRSAKFVVTTELTPPKGIDLSEFFTKADALKSIVDAINITESPRARLAVEPSSSSRPDKSMVEDAMCSRGTAVGTTDSRKLASPISTS